MAVTNLVVLNPADKTRHFSVALGEGAPAASDAIVTDVKTYPIGSQYTDKTGKNFYVRVAEAKVAEDWKKINA